MFHSRLVSRPFSSVVYWRLPVIAYHGFSLPPPCPLTSAQNFRRLCETNESRGNSPSGNSLDRWSTNALIADRRRRHDQPGR
ncbi:MAG TPA: hypothetical protein VFX01_08035, partial [Methylophilaceae bacterium]|nr:hypothetical protein [Methylophilaceae bacterium]